MRKVLVLSAALLLAVSQQASAVIVFNEIFINPPGTDGGQEFVELMSTGGGVESLTGLTLVIIEGDGTGAGVIDQAIALSGSTGSNGLWLRRDASSVIDSSSASGIQGPDAATSVSVVDFNPDIENGSNTYLLVTGFTGTLTTDLDSTDDGVLESTPWTSVLDAVSLIENDGVSNFGYASQFSGTTIGPFSGFNADVIVRLTSGGWLATDLLGTNPGGFYAADTATDRSAFVGVSGSPTLAGLTPLTAVGATPGTANPGFAAIPEPGAYLFGGITTLLTGAGVYRRRFLA